MRFLNFIAYFCFLFSFRGQANPVTDWVCYDEATKISVNTLESPIIRIYSEELNSHYAQKGHEVYEARSLDADYRGSTEKEQHIFYAPMYYPGKEFVLGVRLEVDREKSGKAHSGKARVFTFDSGFFYFDNLDCAGSD